MEVASYTVNCNFRLVAMDNCPPNHRPLQQDFNIVPWVLNEYLPRLLTMQVVWEVIIGELLWKVLKTKLCINHCCKFWNGARGKNKVKELVPSYSWLMSSSLCKKNILLLFVASFFILTIFLSFLTWLIFMDISFPHMQNGSNSGSKPLTAGPTCARLNCKKPKY